jgi:hypothetical protein
VCPKANKSAIRARKLHENARKELVGQGQEPSPSIFFIVLLGIGQVARLIGCSVWTVRQTLIPRGLPHFRFKSRGRLVFYHDQIVRWIEKEQGLYDLPRFSQPVITEDFRISANSFGVR